MTTRPKLRPAVRRPNRVDAKTPDVSSQAANASLRLAIGKDGIGLELATPARLGCLQVTALSATFQAVRFPVDVSGGVARFRHRRGELQRVELELAARALERWAAPRLAGIVSTRAPDVWVSVAHARATICVSVECDADDGESRAGPAIAFDVHALVEDERLVLVVANARGANLAASATALAIASVRALLAPIVPAAGRRGAVFSLPHVAEGVARALFPEAGARVPAVAGVTWSVLGAHADTWILQAHRGAVPSPPSPDAIRAHAVAVLLGDGDDALVAGDVETARSAFFDVLERSPRHHEIVRRIVEIDARTMGREEAALSMFAEMLSAPHAIRMGTARGELLAAVGDTAAAIASLELAAEAEGAPALSSRAYERAASLARDPEDAARWLDHALARAPRALSARQSRVRARLSLGRVEDAVADVAHLEALASGTRAKHAVWVRAGRAFQGAGLRTRARDVFERALRYAPDDAQSLAGLGEALVAQEAAPRGVSILTHALKLARERGEPTGPILLPLARAFAERFDDLPTAIAHIASVPVDCAEAPAARGLEARWRARLGDFVGASIAFARLREIAASLVQSSLETASPFQQADEGIATIVRMLLEGADLELASLRDPLAAQRHLTIALRLRPHDPQVRRAARELGAMVLARSAGSGEVAQATAGSPARPSGPIVASESGEPDESGPLQGAGLEAEPIERLRVQSFEPAGDASDDSVLATRAEDLTRRVQADPGNESASDELAALLEALGRGHELLALLLGRLEDLPRARRHELVPRVRQVLERLAAASEGAGRSDEAVLFRTMPLDE